MLGTTSGKPDRLFTRSKHIWIVWPGTRWQTTSYFCLVDARAAEAPPSPCIAQGNQIPYRGALVTKPARAESLSDQDQTRSPLKGHENLTIRSPGARCNAG
jgi:hypothetical protein